VIPFIGLNAKYCAIESGVHARIEEVLQHGQYIIGPDLSERDHDVITGEAVSACSAVAA
jgi:UDP-2-acetamido-2-deoxy-ribo-hexuluronate aminotransferase